MGHRMLLVFSLCLLPIAGPAFSQTDSWVLVQKIKAPESSLVSFALDGNELAVLESQSKKTRIQLYTRKTETSRWVPEVQLDTVPVGRAGYVLMDDGTLVSGYAGDFAGMTAAGFVSVFKKTAGTWSITQKIVEQEPMDFHAVGNHLALHHGTLVVGISATSNLSYMSAIEIFNRDPSTGKFALQYTIRASDLTPDALIGTFSLLDTGLAVATFGPAALHIFRYDGASSWVEEGSFPLDGVVPNISLYKDHLALTDNYVVKIFKRNTDEWDFESKIIYDEGNPQLDEFGYPVFLSDNYLVAGALDSPYQGKKFVGKIFIYSKDARTGGWTKIQTINSEAPQEFEHLGVDFFDGQTLIASDYDSAKPPKWTMYYYSRKRAVESAISESLPPGQGDSGRSVAPPTVLPTPEVVSPVGAVAAQCPTYIWKRVEGATEYTIHFRFPAQRSSCGKNYTTIAAVNTTITVKADDYCTLDLCYLGFKKVPGRIFRPTHCDGKPVVREWAVSAASGSVKSQESPFASYQWDGSKKCPY